MDDIYFAIDWKVNIVGLMTWTVSQMPGKMQNDQLKKTTKAKIHRLQSVRTQNKLFTDKSPRTIKQLMECPKATRNDFSTHNIQEDVLLQVCSNFLHDVEQIRNELPTMHQERRNLRTKLQEHRVNCMEGNFRPWAPNQKGNQKIVRFCNYCHRNGHTPKWCRKKMRDEERRRVQHDLSFNKNFVPIREGGTSDSNCRSQHDQNVDRCPDSDDVNFPTNIFLTCEDGTCQDESDDVTPLESKFILTTNGMSCRMAQFNSAEESDDELSDPLPLGYWNPRESFFSKLLSYTFLYIFIFRNVKWLSLLYWLNQVPTWFVGS